MSLESMMGPTVEDTPKEQPEKIHQETDNDELEKEKAPPLRSWRKKYRKLKVRFNRIMDESHVLFKEERRALALARRLQEENDQLMEMLIDFNDHNNDANLKALVADCTIERTSIPQNKTSNGTDSNSQGFDFDPDYLSTILKMPHRQYDMKDVIAVENDEHPIADPGTSDYLDSVYEEEYILNMDVQLVDDELFNDPNKPLEKPKSRVLPGDKELTNQNSDSVLSWLRRHHPETFIQEKDPAEPKPEKKPRSSNKRASGAAPPKPDIKPEPEPEVEEEVPAGENAEKWKGRKHRMTKEDEAYRPKGGSSRGSKRKREEPDGKNAGRGKRAKGQSSPSAVQRK